MKKNALIVMLIVLATILISVLPSVGHAANFPNKPVQFYVGYAAGGSTDTIVRTLAKIMEESLGQPVVVVNKPGAGGGVMAVALRGATPDGYTIGATTAITLTFNPLVKKVDYSLDDFKAIGAVSQFQEAFVSLPDKPWKDFKGLIEYAKKHSGLTYASQHPIDQAILSFVARKEGIQWKAIPTKGGEEIMTAILGKHVDFGFSGGIHVSFVKAGKMIVLANPGTNRLLGSPEVPTLKELGYNVSFLNYNILLVPKGTPEPIVKSLADAVAKAEKDPRYVNVVQKQLLMPAEFIPGPKLGKILHEQLERNRALLHGK